MAISPLLGGPATPRPVRRQPGPSAADDPGLLRRIGNTALGGISAVGNLLDLPGSSVRDIAAGQNPFDQWLSPFSGENRTSGRDLLRHYGLASHRDTTGNFLGGLAVEVLLDPFFAFPKATTRALTGLVNNPATRAAGRYAAGTRAGQWAGKNVVAPAMNLADVGWRHARAALDPRVRGAVTPELQAAMPALAARRRQVTTDVLAETLPMARMIENAGLGTADEAARMRQVLEGVLPWEDQTGVLRKMADLNRDTLWAAEDAGRIAKPLQDVVEHFPRRMGRDVAEALGGPRPAATGPLATSGASTVGREEVWKGFSQGTEGVNTLLRDPEIARLIDARKAQGGAKAGLRAVKDVEQYIAQRYGSEITQQFQRRSDDGRLLFRDPVGRKLAVSDAKIQKYGRVLPDGRIEYTVPRGTGTSTSVLEPLMRDRYREIAKTVVRNPELREKGLFTNHPLADFHDATLASRLMDANAGTVLDVLAQPGVLQGPRSAFRSAGEQVTTVGDLMREFRLSGQGASLLAERLGVPVKTIPPDQLPRVLKGLRRQVVKPDVAADLRKTWPNYTAPSDVAGWLKLYDSTTAAFKAGVLTWPARYVRDVMSGMARNWEMRMLSPRALRDAHSLLQGGTLKGLADLPAIQDWLQRTGRQVNDQTATEAASEMFAALKGHNVQIATEGFQPGVGGLGDLLQALPGHTPALQPSQLASTFSGRANGTTRNPLDIAGVMDRTGKVRQTTRFGPAAAGNIVGRYTDDLNRLVPFIHQLRRGKNVDELRDAMSRIMRAQVDYGPDNFTRFDKHVAKRLLPFWSYTSRQLPYVAMTLAQQPGGRMAQTIRAARLGASDDPTLPEHVAQSTAIPIETLPDGSKRFLNGIGLMHEDPLAFFGGGVRGALTEAGSRLNPVLKGLVEGGTGESLFQRSPQGGRDLDEMDPLAGRLVSNVRERLGFSPWEAPSGRAHNVGGAGLEFLLANSPLSRLLSTARTATDPRKGLGTRAANLLTGLRFTDVSPATQDTTLREKALALEKSLGARTFERPYFTKETLDRMTPQDRATAEQLQALMNELARRAKSRKKAG